MEKKISAFPDGNSYATFAGDASRLIIGNSGGVAKIFDVSQPDLEPHSVDITENLTCLAHHGDAFLVASTAGTLEMAKIDTSEAPAVIFRSELPIRDSIFINGGKRILCGGDDNKVVVIDTASSATSNITTDDQVLNLAYNPTGELVAVSLADQSVAVFSVVHETPTLVDTIRDVLPQKIHKSLDVVDYLGQNEDELLATAAGWTADGEFLLVPSSTRTLKIYSREDFSTPLTEVKPGLDIVDYAVCGNSVATLHKDGVVKVTDIDLEEETHQFRLSKLTTGHVPISVVWSESTIYVGTSSGDVLVVENVVALEPKKTTKATGLFLDEADESDNEDLDTRVEKAPTNGHAKYRLDDSIIDDDEDFDELRDRLAKRQKTEALGGDERQLQPYCPGSTPWAVQNGTKTRRRYICMNASGYVWAVKSDQSHQQSITVSFFDRSVNKDYHFIDYQDFDLCSMNESAIVFGSSGRGKNGASVSFRHHQSSQDAWERHVPLSAGEYVTSLSLAATSDDSGTIVVGTNYGSIRFFSIHGLCINAIQASPVAALISSSLSFLFMVNQMGETFTYSIIDVHQDYKYVQQDVVLPLSQPTAPQVPLIKGLFFNEYNDPCMVTGQQDTLMILSSWREPRNARWVPLLDCNLAVRDNGHEAKRNWSCWPLGLYRDFLSCLILKGGSVYPGFPLALPIEIPIKLPIAVEKDQKDEKNEEDPEEGFVRASTMGRIVSDTLGDEAFEDSNDEIMDRLQEYSMIFDKSLLKLFANACQEAKLNKAQSIAKLLRTDKALTAAARIAERLEFLNLATKIGKLREEMGEE